MDWKRRAAAAAALACLGGAAQAMIIIRNAPTVRTRAETCTLLQGIAHSPSPFDDKSAAATQAQKQAVALARRAHQDICVRHRGEPDPAIAADGSQHFGQMVDGRPEGIGARFYIDGSRYIGEWKAGLRDGEGMGMQADGARYVGHWDDDKPHGSGEVQYHARIGIKVVNPNAPASALK